MVATTQNQVEISSPVCVRFLIDLRFCCSLKTSPTRLESTTGKNTENYLKKYAKILDEGD
jgi:hypothetical protein